jgi:DNA-binding Lrp family transcriptional regulator
MAWAHTMTDHDRNPDRPGWRPSRAFWVIPAQPLQELYGAQGDARDPVAATVLMALIAGMSMNDGFQGLPAYHVSISQREIAQRTGLGHKAVRNALRRLEKRAHIIPEKAPSDGIRRGTNSRIMYRIDLLADEATAFHDRGTSAGTSAGTRGLEKGTSYIQTESSDREQTPAATAVEEIAEARKRYTPDQLVILDAAVADFARTRKTGRMAESRVAGEYRWWAGFPPEQVVAGLQTYIEKRYASDSKRKDEKYARGIIRNTDPLTAGLDAPGESGASTNGRPIRPPHNNYLSPEQLREAGYVPR